MSAVKCPKCGLLWYRQRRHAKNPTHICSHCRWVKSGKRRLLLRTIARVTRDLERLQAHGQCVVCGEDAHDPSCAVNTLTISLQELDI